MNKKLDLDGWPLPASHYLLPYVNAHILYEIEKGDILYKAAVHRVDTTKRIIHIYISGDSGLIPICSGFRRCSTKYEKLVIQGMVDSS